MSNNIQAVIGLAIFVVLAFILAHLARRWGQAKVPTASTLAQQQLAESMLKLVEDTAWSEHFAASAAMHKKRIARLQAQGVTLPASTAKKAREYVAPLGCSTNHWPIKAGRAAPPSPVPQPSSL